MGGVTGLTATSTMPLQTVTVEQEGSDDLFRRFVSPDGSRAGAGHNVLGVGRTGGADGALIPVDVAGLVLVQAGEMFPADTGGGKRVKSNASGQAVAAAAGDPAAGIAIDAASGAGVLVRVLLGVA